MTWRKIPISRIKHSLKHYLKSNDIIINKTKLNTCLCDRSATDSAEPKVLLIIHVIIFVPNFDCSIKSKTKSTDHSTSLLLKFTSSRKSLLLQTVSSQPKVTIIKHDNIDFILTIGFETKTFFDGMTNSLSLMLLLIVNVLTSVHESFLQLNVSGEPKVT